MQTLSKSTMNETMNMHEQCMKYNFVAPLSCKKQSQGLLHLLDGENMLFNNFFRFLVYLQNDFLIKVLNPAKHKTIWKIT